MRRCWTQSDSPGKRNGVNRNSCEDKWRGCVCVWGGSEAWSRWINHSWSEKVWISHSSVKYQHAHVSMYMMYDVRWESEEFIMPIDGGSWRRPCWLCVVVFRRSSLCPSGFGVRPDGGAKCRCVVSFTISYWHVTGKISMTTVDVIVCQTVKFKV